jgi:hypothetical protein
MPTRRFTTREEWLYRTSAMQQFAESLTLKSFVRRSRENYSVFQRRRTTAMMLLSSGNHRFTWSFELQDIRFYGLICVMTSIPILFTSFEKATGFMRASPRDLHLILLQKKTADLNMRCITTIAAADVSCAAGIYLQKFLVTGFLCDANCSG